MPALISNRTADALAVLLREPDAPARAGGAILSAPWAVECGALIGTSPRPNYNGTVQWVGALSGPTDSPGATDGVVLAELNGGTLIPGRVYLAHPGGVTSAGKPILWTDASAGQKTASGADSCAAVLLAGSGNCVRATVVSAIGLCATVNAAQSIALTWDTDHFESGATDWVNADASTGQVTYTPGATPAATVDGVAGLYLGCSGDGGALFAFKGNPPCASGTATPCGDALVLRFDCECCSIANWGGPNKWYCVDGVATYLVAADRCDTDITIDSGPYDTEAEAEADCPGAVSAPCQSNNFSTGTLAVTFQNQTGDCTCLTIPIVANQGTDQFDISTASCPGNLGYELRCTGGQYVLTVTGGVTATVSSFTASPFELIYLMTGFGANCGGSGGTAELKITWVP